MSSFLAVSGNWILISPIVIRLIRIIIITLPTNNTLCILWMMFSLSSKIHFMNAVPSSTKIVDIFDLSTILATSRDFPASHFVADWHISCNELLPLEFNLSYLTIAVNFVADKFPIIGVAILAVSRIESVKFTDLATTMMMISVFWLLVASVGGIAVVERLSSSTDSGILRIDSAIVARMGSSVTGSSSTSDSIVMTNMGSSSTADTIMVTIGRSSATNSIVVTANTGRSSFNVI